MVTVENSVGRVVELRIESPVSPEELRACLMRFSALASEITGRLVPVADCRKARIFPPEVEEGFSKLMRSDNPRMERAAILVSESAVFSLQLERMVREAGNPRRRAFRVESELTGWLAEVLEPGEQTRLDAFFAEGR